MALGGSNKTLVITTRFDADASGYFQEVDKLNGKQKEAQAAAQGLAKSLGDAIKLDRVQKAFGALGAELGGTVKAMVDTTKHGIEMGSVFGPMGAAIGGVAGALVGLIGSTNAQTEAEKRAAEAAKKHADELQRIYEGETKIRGLRRGTREAEDIGYEEFSAAQRKNAAIGSEASAADVERTRRAYREAQIEREALNRADGVIWLEQQKREQERLNAIKDIEAARRKGTIEDEEATRRLKDLNKVESDSLDIVGRYKQKQQETAEAVERLNKGLRAGTINAKDYEELLRATDENYRARDDERKRREQEAIARARQLAEERRKLASEEAKRLTDELVKQLESEADHSVTSPLGAPKDYTAGINTEDLYKKQVVANDQLLVQRQAMADAIQREIDLQREYTSLVGEAYGAIVSGSSGALSTFKNIAKQQLIAKGTVEAVEAASQLAYGFGALANPLFAGAAAMHFTSAAKHAAAAALAGVGVAALGAIGGGGGGGGGGGTSSNAGTTTTPNKDDRDHRTGQGGDGGRDIIYVYGDPFADDNPRQRALTAERQIRRVVPQFGEDS